MLPAIALPGKAGGHTARGCDKVVARLQETIDVDIW